MSDLLKSRLELFSEDEIAAFARKHAEGILNDPNGAQTIDDVDDSVVESITEDFKAGFYKCIEVLKARLDQ